MGTVQTLKLALQARGSARAWRRSQWRRIRLPPYDTYLHADLKWRLSIFSALIFDSRVDEGTPRRAADSGLVLVAKCGAWECRDCGFVKRAQLSAFVEDVSGSLHDRQPQRVDTDRDYRSTRIEASGLWLGRWAVVCGPARIWWSCSGSVRIACGAHSRPLGEKSRIAAEARGLDTPQDAPAQP